MDVFGDGADAFCIFRFEGDGNGQSQPCIADGRDTVILRRKSGTWKAIHSYASLVGHRPMTNEGGSR
jgi:hypothetical protein